jgi:CheY-like chemotaxis protein
MVCNVFPTPPGPLSDKIPMSLPRILINEDSESDQQLILAEFSRVQFRCETHCVSTREAFRQALETFAPDLILSDYALAGYDGLDAIAMAKARCPDVPIVILTIALNEETAVECMKRGATDYVLKNRLPSIVPIVTSILERRSMAREKARLEFEHEQLFKLTPNLFCVVELSSCLKEVNPAWTTRLGYSPAELLGRPLTRPSRRREKILRLVAQPDLARLAGHRATRVRMPPPPPQRQPPPPRLERHPSPRRRQNLRLRARRHRAPPGRIRPPRKRGALPRHGRLRARVHLGHRRQPPVHLL